MHAWGGRLALELSLGVLLYFSALSQGWGLVYIGVYVPKEGNGEWLCQRMGTILNPEVSSVRNPGDHLHYIHLCRTKKKKKNLQPRRAQTYPESQGKLVGSLSPDYCLSLFHLWLFYCFMLLPTSSFTLLSTFRGA